MSLKDKEAIAIIKEKIKEEYITFLIKINSFFQEKKDKPQREKIRKLCDYLCLKGFDYRFIYSFQDFYLGLDVSLKEKLIIPIPIWPNTCVYYIFSDDLKYPEEIEEHTYYLDKYKIVVILANDLSSQHTLNSIGTLVL